MDKLGIKIAEKRKGLGMTQIELAERMHVTRQTVSRWEAGTALPDIDKIGEIADILGVSCDYLLKDEAVETGAAQANGVGKLLKSMAGKTVPYRRSYTGKKALLSAGTKELSCCYRRRRVVYSAR